MRILLCNCPPSEATVLANTLVQEGLAACVNILPTVRSIYLWDGAVQDDVESTLLIKVREPAVDLTVARIEALHSYDVPEILVLPVDADRSSAAYVAWVRATGQP